MTWPNTSRGRFYFILSVPEDMCARAGANPQYIFRADKTAPFINRKSRSFANADDENGEKSPAGRAPLLGNYLEKLLLDFSVEL